MSVREGVWATTRILGRPAIAHLQVVVETTNQMPCRDQAFFTVILEKSLAGPTNFVWNRVTSTRRIYLPVACATQPPRERHLCDGAMRRYVIETVQERSSGFGECLLVER